MRYVPCDLTLVGAVDEHDRAWLVFHLDACGAAGPGELRVLEASVRLAGLDDDPHALRRAITDRLNALSAERGAATVRRLLCDSEGQLRLILWAPDTP